MLIAQISDTHMLPPGEIAYGLADTEAALVAAVEAVNAARPDLVIHTGDVAHHGAPEAYALTREIMDGLVAPWCAIPGNHDDRANFRAAFRETSWLPARAAAEGFLHYTLDAGALRIVALDTVIPGAPEGELCDARLEWLREALGEAPGQPTVVAMHHPPFTAGLPGFSEKALGGAARLAAILGDNPQVVRVIAGHIHRSIVGMCGPAPVVVGPSASYPFAFDRTADAPLSISFEAPGVAMHLWTEAHGLLSHTVALGERPPAKPLLKDGQRLLPTSTRRV